MRFYILLLCCIISVMSESYSQSFCQKGTWIVGCNFLNYSPFTFAKSTFKETTSVQTFSPDTTFTNNSSWSNSNSNGRAIHNQWRAAPLGGATGSNAEWQHSCWRNDCSSFLHRYWTCAIATDVCRFESSWRPSVSINWDSLRPPRDSCGTDKKRGQ